jgi:hypothetical protein
MITSTKEKIIHQIKLHIRQHKQFPDPFSGMLSLLSILSFDFLNLECLNSGDHAYFVAVYLWCAIPISIGAVVAIVGLLRYFLESLSHKNTDDELDAIGSPASKLSYKIVSQHVWLLLFLSYIVLPPVSNKQLAVFDCITLASGKRFVRSDTSIDCDSPEYEVFSIHILLLLIAYQCIPVVWFILLYRQRNALNPPTSQVDEKLALFIRESNEDLAPLRFLFVDYKCSRWWFEVVDMYRRITFIGILPLISPISAIRSSVGMVLAFASAVYFREEEPYQVSFTNVIAHIAQVV